MDISFSLGPGLIILHFLLILNSCEVVKANFCHLWEFAAGPLIELDAEHRQFEADLS